MTTDVLAIEECGCQVLKGSRVKIAYCLNHAAAPALLEACKGIYEYEGLGDCSSDNPESGSWQSGGLEKTFDKVVAAIRLAEGNEA